MLSKTEKMPAPHPMIEPFKEGRNSDYENGFIAGCNHTKESAEADRDKFAVEFARYLCDNYEPCVDQTWISNFPFDTEYKSGQQLLEQFKNREK